MLRILDSVVLSHAMEHALSLAALLARQPSARARTPLEVAQDTSALLSAIESRAVAEAGRIARRYDAELCTYRRRLGLRMLAGAFCREKRNAFPLRG